MKHISRSLLRFLSRAARPYLKTYGLLQTAKVFNRSALVWEPGSEKIVVLAPHMDDEVIGCGGTLARHIERGAEITIIYLSDGRHGGVTPAGLSDVSRTRKREAALAMEALGIRKIIFMDAEDGTLDSTPELAVRLRELLEKIRPELVYLPFFLEEHPDHRAVSKILTEAIDSGKHLFRCMAYEVWTPLFPNCLVRIDATIEQKKRALGHYQSQLAETDYLHSALGLNAYRSTALLGGTCRYAEAFCSLSLPEYLGLYQEYMATDATRRPVKPNAQPFDHVHV